MVVDHDICRAVDGRLTSLVRCIRTSAIRALREELVTYPKPGLVSLVDAGSHHDMTALTFARSTMALRHYFGRIAEAGAAGARFEVLRRLGIAAEVRMLRATGGVNTHRGAVFHLGLLAAAAAHRATSSRASSGRHLGQVVDAVWGCELRSHRRDPASHGSRVDARHGTGGALAEAIAGLPAVFEVGLPAYRAVLARGGSSNQARVQAFFSLMAVLHDTNLLHRGGAAGLAIAHRLSLDFLAAGGVEAPDWFARAVATHRVFCQRGLSPGGSADMLSACIFVHAVETQRAAPGAEEATA